MSAPSPHTPPGEFETSAVTESSPAGDLGRFSPAQPVQSLGEMLRNARESRCLSVIQLATVWAKSTGIGRSFASEWIRVFESHGSNSNSDRHVTAILDALSLCEPMSSQERDAFYVAAKLVPPDLAALILANPGRLDAVRALLAGREG